MEKELRCTWPLPVQAYRSFTAPLGLCPTSPSHLARTNLRSRVWWMIGFRGLGLTFLISHSDSPKDVDYSRRVLKHQWFGKFRGLVRDLGFEEPTQLQEISCKKCCLI